MTPTPSLENVNDILLLAVDADVIGIDEAQFFNDGIIPVCETLVMQGKRVIVAGLDMDYLGKPFGPMPQLLAIADFITKLHAICVQCGHLANVSYRTSTEEGTVVLGEKNNYEPRCRICAAK
jgi:thymidine kinase